MSKVPAAFLLGILSLFVFFFIGEKASYHWGNAGLVVGFVLMAAFFFTCQFLLSRGNPDAHRKDWPVMLALDIIWIVMFILMVISERIAVIVVQGLGLLVGCFGATWAGALAASLKARRKLRSLP